MDKDFLDIGFFHYEAFGGPFFNHFVGWLTQMGFNHPSEYVEYYTATFWIIAFLLLSYSLISSFEIKQSFKFWYDWEMSWRNPAKKLLFGNIISRFFVGLILMYTALLPIPVIQMTPLVQSDSSGESNVRAWLINDMKTSITEGDMDVAARAVYADLDGYFSENKKVNSIPLIFYPISFIESVYYGFPDISLGDDNSPAAPSFIDVGHYKSTGVYRMRGIDEGANGNAPTILSCIRSSGSNDPDALILVNNQEVGSGSLTARIVTDISKFTCPNQVTNDVIASAEDSFASLLFGHEVVSAAYKDFFAPIDGMFEILMINSYSSLINKGINASVATNMAVGINLDQSKSNYSKMDKLDKYRAQLTKANRLKNEKLIEIATTLQGILALNSSMAMPKELVDFAYYQLINANASTTTGGDWRNNPEPVQEVIWGQNGRFPNKDYAKQLAKLTPPPTLTQTATNFYNDLKSISTTTAAAVNVAATNADIKNLEVRYLAANSKPAVLKGVCGVSDCSTYKVFSVNSEKSKIEQAIKASFERQFADFFEHNSSDVEKILKATEIKLSHSASTSTLSLEIRDNDLNTIQTLTVDTAGGTQDLSLIFGSYTYAEEAMNTIAYKELDKILISTILSYSYAEEMNKRLVSFKTKMKSWETQCKNEYQNQKKIKACITVKFTKSDQTKINIKHIVSEVSTKVPSSLFGYYKSQFYSNGGSQNFQWRNDGSVILPNYLFPLDFYDITYPDSSYAAPLPFLYRYLDNSIWQLSMQSPDLVSDLASFNAFIESLENNYRDAYSEENFTPEQVDSFFEEIKKLKLVKASDLRGVPFDGTPNSVDEEIESLKQWAGNRLIDTSGKLQDTYNLEKSFIDLFSSANSIFFKKPTSPEDIGGIFHEYDPSSFSILDLSGANMNQTKSFASLEKYYKHNSVYFPWSGSPLFEGTYQTHRKNIAKTISSDGERSLLIGFKREFLEFVMAMRPYVQLSNNKIVFQAEYQDRIVNKHPGLMALIPNSTSFIDTLSYVISEDIKARTSNLKTLKEALVAAKKNHDADAISEAESALLDASQISGGDGSALSAVRLLIDKVWKVITIILGPIRDLQNTIVAQSTDRYSINSYSIYPEYLIGKYDDRGGREIIAGHQSGGGKYILPVGATIPGSKNSSLSEETGSVVAEFIQAMGIGEVATGAGIAFLAVKGVKGVFNKFFKRNSNNSIWSKVKSLIYIVFGAIFYLFMKMLAFVLGFIAIMLRLVFLGILAGVFGMFTACVLYPLNLLTVLLGYQPEGSGGQDSPLKNLISKIPKAQDTFFMAAKQLSVWIMAMTVVFLLIYVHKVIFYPLAKEVSFEAWISSVGSGEYLSTAGWGAMFTIFFIGVIYYYLIRYSYERLLKYIETVTVSMDNDLMKSTKEMLEKNSSMFNKLKTMSGGAISKGIGRKE